MTAAVALDAQEAVVRGRREICSLKIRVSRTERLKANRLRQRFSVHGSMDTNRLGVKFHPSGSFAVLIRFAN